MCQVCQVCQARGFEFFTMVLIFGSEKFHSGFEFFTTYYWYYYYYYYYRPPFMNFIIGLEARYVVVEGGPL